MTRLAMDRRNRENILFRCCFITGLAIGLVGLAKIGMGFIYMHHCDIEQMIPIYLIVSGLLTLLFVILIANSFRHRDRNEDDFFNSLGRHSENGLAILFLIVFVSIIASSFLRLDRHEDEIIVSLLVLCGVIWRGLPAFLLHTLWLIRGSMWVYPNYWTLHSNELTCSQNVISYSVQGTCNMTLLTFAFSMVTIDWICFSLVVISLMICWRALTY